MASLGCYRLKNAADEKATIWSGLRQLQTYKVRNPDPFFIQCLSGHFGWLEARMGRSLPDPNRSCPGRTMTGETYRPCVVTQLQVMSSGRV